MNIPPHIKASILVVDGIPLTKAVINGEMRTFIIDSGAPCLIVNANYHEENSSEKAKEFEGVGGKGKQGLCSVMRSKKYLKKVEVSSIVSTK